MSGQAIMQRWNAFAARHTLLLDSLLAGAIILLTVIPELFSHSTTEGIWRASLGFVACAALAIRRVHADIAGYIIAAVGFTHIAVGGDLIGSVTLAGVMGCYAMPAYGSRLGGRIALMLAVVGGGSVAVRFFFENGSDSTGETGSWIERTFAVVVTAGVAAGLWAMGMLRRIRRREIEGLRDRARLLEQERAQEAELAVVGERTRIAREMHDIIAHSLTVIIAQADGGRYAARGDAAAAEQALQTISNTGRSALADMRGLLGVLRDDSPRDMAALPSVGDVPGLINDVAAGGLPVRLTVTGEVREVPTGTGLTAYRIVQESLTNVLKHAGHLAAVHVELDWTEEQLEITVTDEGSGDQGPVHAAPGSGKGVLGMRERAELHGGTLAAGPHLAGYRVRAVLPYRAGS